MISRLALLGIASLAIAASPAVAVGKKKNVSWGKPGVSYTQYRKDAIDPGAFVVAGTRSWTQDVEEAAADPLPFDNVAYALHFYAATHKQKLRDKAELAMRRGAALFVTEYGVTAANGDLPIDVAETRLWWDWCERHGISYLAWSICDKAEASAAVRPGSSPEGGWKESELTDSGRLIRDRLRAMQ